MDKNHREIIQKLIKNPPQNEDDLLVVKRKIAKKYGVKLPTNSELLEAYRNYCRNAPWRVPTENNLARLLRKRKIRTLSGVAPIAVLTKPYKCPGQCVYCPSEKKMPKSYLSNEPAVMRAVLCDFDPFKQVALRIRALENNGHNTDKLELIVMGGTWDYLPEKYRLWYIYACFCAANNPAIKIQNPKFQIQNKLKIQNSKKIKIEIDEKIKLKSVSQITWQNLEREQKKNETAKHRIVGLTLETRPDFVTEKSIWEMRRLGGTRVELGVQHLDDKILKLNQRGHTVAETIKATRILRDFGFKITYHLMPNLPGSTPAKDLAMFKKIFSDPNFQPDQIKIYPCVVTRNAKLYRWWRQGKYQSYNQKQLKKLLMNIKKIVPYYVRIIRVIRDIPEESIVAGNKVSNLRHLLKAKCHCIRCREVGHQKSQKSKVKSQKFGVPLRGTKLFIQKYKAGGGTEYFLSFESPDRKILYAFLRLYLPNKNHSHTYSHSFAYKFACFLDGHAIIRELHTYGQLVPISDKIKLPARLAIQGIIGGASQHQGLGKKLMATAEKIARQNGFQQIAVIAGVGVREYYRKLGYKLKETYLVKKCQICWHPDEHRDDC